LRLESKLSTTKLTTTKLTATKLTATKLTTTKLTTTECLLVHLRQHLFKKKNFHSKLTGIVASDFSLDGKKLQQCCLWEEEILQHYLWLEKIIKKEEFRTGFKIKFEEVKVKFEKARLEVESSLRIKLETEVRFKGIKSEFKLGFKELRSELEELETEIKFFESQFEKKKHAFEHILFLKLSFEDEFKKAQVDMDTPFKIELTKYDLDEFGFSKFEKVITDDGVHHTDIDKLKKRLELFKDYVDGKKPIHIALWKIPLIQRVLTFATTTFATAYKYSKVTSTWHETLKEHDGQIFQHIPRDLYVPYHVHSPTRTYSMVAQIASHDPILGEIRDHAASVILRMAKSDARAIWGPGRTHSARKRRTTERQCILSRADKLISDILPVRGTKLSPLCQILIIHKITMLWDMYM
jgi:hypothetical protein